eukprot:scaffold2505_cov157-Skeletonema_menzelii.AAC.6
MISYTSAFLFLLACSSSITSTAAWSSCHKLDDHHCRRRHRHSSCRSSSIILKSAAAHQQDSTHTAATSSSPNTSSGSTAIILNLNARSVSGSSKELIALASSIVGEQHVYVTRTIEDALCAARKVVRQGRDVDYDTTSTIITGNGNSTTTANDSANHHGNNISNNNGGGDNVVLPYSLVVPVGGDGTLSGWIDGMVNEIMLLDTDIHDNEINNNNSSSSNDDGDDSHSHHYHQMKVHEAVGRLPTIGYIPMGTGNGLGYVIGCRMPKSKSQLICAESDNDDTTKKKKWRDRIKSKLSIKRRKVEHAGRVMRSLKQIGDVLQQQEQQHYHQQQQQPKEYSVVEMPLMEVTHHGPDEQNITTKGDLCFFAGSGFDSLMLEDFKQVKAWSTSPQRSWTPSFVKDLLSSVAGYSVALVTKTLPRALLHQTHKISVKVTTTDEGTLWIDHRRGDFSELAVDLSSSGEEVKKQGVEDIGEESDGDKDGATTTTTKKKKKRQHLIYSGITGILAASTTPFYGGGMRLFPYARLFPNKLQLRIGRISPLTGFLRIPAIFEGSYRDKSEGTFGCLDFVGDDFEVEVSSTRYEEYLKRKKELKESKKKTRWWGQTKRSQNNETSDESTKLPTGFPFQHSGESMGIKERFRVRVVKQPVKFISLLKPRIVVDD